MTTYVCAPSRVSSHTHYINADLCCRFLICGYGIFLPLRHTISYPRTMSAYDLCIYFSLPFVSILWRHFFVPFSFVSRLYPVLYPSVSTLGLIPSTPLSMLNLISSLFDLTLTKYPTPLCVSDYILCIQALMFKQKYITGKSYVDSVRHIYRFIIFNFSIRFLWLNATYIILNFFCNMF